MLADEADAAGRGKPFEGGACNFALTISAADLCWIGDDDFYSQGNYDYNAHAQVHVGGADPLESQGYASAVNENPSSS
jgi:hypothetical protein